MAARPKERIILTPHKAAHEVGGFTETTSIRARYIQNLTNCLHVCLLKGDVERATKAWAILIRCREVDWQSRWYWGLELLSAITPPHALGQEDTDRDIEKYLKTIRLSANEADKSSLLHALVLHYIKSGRYREALDELETYLTGYPYLLSGPLHTYAGLLSFYLAQPAAARAPPRAEEERAVSSVVSIRDSTSPEAVHRFEPADLGMLSSAKAWFAKALDINKDDEVASEFVRLIDSPDESGLTKMDLDSKRDIKSRSSSPMSED